MSIALAITGGLIAGSIILSLIKTRGKPGEPVPVPVLMLPTVISWLDVTFNATLPLLAVKVPIWRP